MKSVFWCPLSFFASNLSHTKQIIFCMLFTFLQMCDVLVKTMPICQWDFSCCSIISLDTSSLAILLTFILFFSPVCFVCHVLKWVKIEVKKKKKRRNGHVTFICLKDIMGKFFGTAFLWDFQFVKIKKKKDVIFFYVAEILIIRDVDAKEIFKIPDFIIYSFQK